MSERQTVVGAVLVDSLAAPTRVLAARRTTQPVGLWEFPGGKVEPGETPRAALVRELAEELGVAVTVGEELPGPWRISERLELRLYLAHATGTPRPGDSHDLVTWLDARSLEAVTWLASDAAALPHVRRALREHPGSARHGC